LTEAILIVLAASAALWAVGRFWLRGPDLSPFDAPAGQRFAHPAPSDGQRTVLAKLARVPALIGGLPEAERILALRKFMDELFGDEDLGARFATADAGGVRGEWVSAPGADPSRRVLYIHGGAFTTGSPLSHRRLTAEFARMTGGVVFAPDYRLMPEHRRLDGIEDCRAAYRWLLEHGPGGASPPAKVWVAGDSAGANLALALAAWVRDAGLRAPDGVVAFSPLTDTTLASPSLRANMAGDVMLGPIFGGLARLPDTLLLWLMWMRNRINPRDARVSPARGDLARLPPTLVQASEAEMLRDDARRYVNRAVAAGSPARLQTWDHMVHVWQIFHRELPEAREALEEVRRFLAVT
jgi:acetyl esterase/lipase